MKTLRIFLSAALISILPFSSTFAKDEKPKVAIRINGKEILLTEVNSLIVKDLQRANARGKKITPKIEKKIRKRWIDRVISRELFLQKARAENVTVSDSEIDNNLTGIEKQSIPMTPQKLRQLVKANLMVKKIIEVHVLSKVVVTDQEVRSIYEGRKDKFKQPERARARHILIRMTASDSKKKKEKIRKKAKKVLAIVKTGKIPFSELAKKLSEGPSATNGGDLGYFKRGQMVPAFDKVVFSMKVGEISDLVLTKFGYHIIKLEDKKKAHIISLDEAKKDIRQNLMRLKSSQAIAAWARELRKKAAIEILN